MSCIVPTQRFGVPSRTTAMTSLEKSLLNAMFVDGEAVDA